MDNNEKLLRIGRINFTNVWPLFYYFPMHELRNQVEFIYQVPTGLNRAMASGTIDMGPISSFAYAESFPNYVLFPDMSVSAFGNVKSILLFHKNPLKDIVNGRIALPTTSSSSVNLFKIIVHKFYGGAPEYDYTAPNLTNMMQDRDAALLIGDDAIKASWDNKEYKVTDLGQEWAKWTGHWMTFAACAVRNKTIEAYPDLVAKVYKAFIESKHKALRDPADMVNEAQQTIGGTTAYWMNYFKNLCYDFGSEQWRGLELYYQYAWELGLLPQKVTLKIWSDKKVARVTE